MVVKAELNVVVVNVVVVAAHHGLPQERAPILIVVSTVVEALSAL